MIRVGNGKKKDVEYRSHLITIILCTDSTEFYEFAGTLFKNCVLATRWMKLPSNSVTVANGECRFRHLDGIGSERVEQSIGPGSCNNVQSEISVKIDEVGRKMEKGEVNLKLETRVGGGHVVEQLVAVFAHERLLVIATDVVPRNTVTVHVVQHAQARFLRAVDVELGVVGLRDLLVAALAPRVVRPADRRLVGG